MFVASLSRKGGDSGKSLGGPHMWMDAALARVRGREKEEVVPGKAEVLTVQRE
jgi:hypothetical protein